MKSLAHQFLEFCRSKPPRKRFNFGDPKVCALAQFGRECDHPELIDRMMAPCMVANSEPAVTAAICDEPHTYGALVERLEKALA